MFFGFTNFMDVTSVGGDLGVFIKAFTISAKHFQI